MSKELRSILEHFDSMMDSGGLPVGGVLATVIDVRGSSYRLPGARMLIDENGNTYGTVSGGCLEADLMIRAKRVRETGDAEVFIYDTSINDDSVFGLNMGCRGVIRVLIEPADRKLFEFLRHRLTSKQGGVIATLVSPRCEGGNDSRSDYMIGARLMVDERGLIASDIIADTHTADSHTTIVDDCLRALHTKNSSLKVYEFGEVFIEYVAPPVQLAVFGAGHDAVPLIRFAKELGWSVTLVDHRPAAAAREEFSIADEVIVGRPRSVIGKLTIDADTVTVLMTHNYSIDLELLELLLQSPARYLGLLGPRSRAERLFQDLSSLGVEPTDQQLGRVYAPIGIDIGAETPEEIALSIIAEIRAVLGGRAGNMLRSRNGSIHGREEGREEGREDEGEPASVADVTARSLSHETM